MAHDVFISYAARDKTTADAACATLEADGIRCWIAPRDVLPGANWAGAIIQAIHESHALLLVFSADANKSPQVTREVERAVAGAIPIIPFRIEDVLPSEAMEYYLGSHHWLDAMTPPLQQHLERLAETLRLLLEQRGAERAAAVPPITSRPDDRPPAATAPPEARTAPDAHAPARPPARRRHPPDSADAVPAAAPAEPAAFQATEAEYARCKAEFDSGAITRDEFAQRLQALMLLHDGRYWTIGANSGTWFVREGQDWVEATPPVAASAPALPESPAARPAAPPHAVAPTHVASLPIDAATTAAAGPAMSSPAPVAVPSGSPAETRRGFKGLLVRVIGAIRLKSATYRELAEEGRLQGEARLIVALATAGSSIALFGAAAGRGLTYRYWGYSTTNDLAAGFAVAVTLPAGILLYVWIARRLAAAWHRPVGYAPLFRAIAFAVSPLILGFIPVAGLVVRFWLLATVTVALRQVTGLSTRRAIAAGLIDYILVGIAGSVLYYLLQAFTRGFLQGLAGL